MTDIPTTARDIVERLRRDMPSIPERRNRLRDEAADEIERLRAMLPRADAMSPAPTNPTTAPLTVRALMAELAKCDPDRLVYMRDDCIEVPVMYVLPEYPVGNPTQRVVFLEWTNE